LLQSGKADPAYQTLEKAPAGRRGRVASMKKDTGD